jgi:hypothetical protein
MCQCGMVSRPWSKRGSLPTLGQTWSNERLSRSTRLKVSSGGVRAAHGTIRMGRIPLGCAVAARRSAARARPARPHRGVETLESRDRPRFKEASPNFLGDNRTR